MIDLRHFETFSGEMTSIFGTENGLKTDVLCKNFDTFT